MSNFFMFILTAILFENFVLTKFLGITPFIGASKRINTAITMGIAVTLITTIAAAFSFVLERLLELAGITSLRIVFFMIIVATLVQLLELILLRMQPTIHAGLGIYLPLIITNCLILGVVLMGNMQQLGFFTLLFYAFFSGIGFLLVITIFASLRERMDNSDIPASFNGFPIALVTAALLSMAFMGFGGGLL